MRVGVRVGPFYVSESAGCGPGCLITIAILVGLGGLIGGIAYVVHNPAAGIVPGLFLAACAALAVWGRWHYARQTRPAQPKTRGRCDANTDTGWYQAECPKNTGDGFHVCAGRAGHREHTCSCGHTWTTEAAA